VTPRAVVFDLWQTLAVWPQEASRELYREIAARFGVDEERFASAWVAQRAEREEGRVRDGFIAVAEELGVVDPDLEDVLRLRLDYHREHLVPRPDALATLETFRARGAKIGLISVCSEEVEQLWEGTALAPYFDAVVLSCSVGLRKPDPRIYLLACERLGVEPEECVFVGDGANDELPGAERVGMRAIQLRVPGEPLAPEGERWAGERVESLSELPGLLIGSKGQLA
jgi:putative hydrolase of the HAD superfamily